MGTRICFVHGVGDQKPGFSKPLSDIVRAKTGAETIEHVWNHWVIPEDEIMEMRKFRALASEIILDFIRSLIDYTKHMANLPEADMYVGHSAGSIIIAGSKKPRVFMGSPLRLVMGEAKRTKTIFTISSLTESMNLINNRDVIAHGLNIPGCENVIFNPPLWNLPQRTIPLVAHVSYWDNRFCGEKISEFHNRLFGNTGSSPKHRMWFHRER